MIDWKKKKVAVLGCGVEGLSSAKFLSEKGADVWVLDKKQKGDLDQKNISLLDSLAIQYTGGKAYLNNLADFDVIVRSPGIKLSTPELMAAQKNGATITSQSKLFFDLCPGRIIGVTGTKGKGTTATLLYEMLKKAGRDVYLGGNVGTPPLDFLHKLSKDSWVVLELSSFQLQDIGGSPADAKAMAGKPHIAVMLMVTSEHLDYHKDVYEYVDAKRNLLRFQSPEDFAVLNRDYPATNESDVETDAKVFFVSREREVAEGCFVKDGKVVLRHYAGPARYAKGVTGGSEERSSSTSTKRGPVRSFHPTSARSSLASAANELRASGSPSTSATPEEIEIIRVEKILLPGAHNLENVCAAVMAAILAGVTKETIVEILKTFKGLEHRLELVREVHGVRYYDDSFSTTPETTIAAIEAFKRPEIVILGGSSKKSDFSELGKLLNTTEHIKAVIGIGDEWYRIKEQINLDAVDFLIIEDVVDMHQVVQVAAKVAQPGDVVLLSPACASFGMFRDYKDRGEQFKLAVQEL